MKEMNCNGLELRSDCEPVENALVSFALGDEESDAGGSFRRVEIAVAGLMECEPGDSFFVWNTIDNKEEMQFTLESCDYSFITNLSEVHGRFDVTPHHV